MAKGSPPVRGPNEPQRPAETRDFHPTHRIAGQSSPSIGRLGTRLTPDPNGRRTKQHARTHDMARQPGENHMPQGQPRLHRRLRRGSQLSADVLDVQSGKTTSVAPAPPARQDPDRLAPRQFRNSTLHRSKLAPSCNGSCTKNVGASFVKPDPIFFCDKFCGSNGSSTNHQYPPGGTYLALAPAGHWR